MKIVRLLEKTSLFIFSINDQAIIKDYTSFNSYWLKFNREKRIIHYSKIVQNEVSFKKCSLNRAHFILFSFHRTFPAWILINNFNGWKIIGNKIIEYLPLLLEEKDLNNNLGYY